MKQMLVDVNVRRKDSSAMHLGADTLIPFAT